MKNITQASCCLLLSLLLWMGTGTAKPVDTLNAKTAATHFLMGRTGGNAKSARQVHIVYTGQALDESSQRTVPCYYIINMNQGFVIISADDRIEPILGYSTEGNFNAEDIPDNLRAFLNGYSTQIKEYLHDAPDCPNEASAKWASLMREDYTQNATKGAVIGPLLETTWDQNSPYNVLCPADANGPGGYVYAGCVATAMAQVIRYWEYPSTGAGNKSYICNFSSSSGGEYGDYGTLSAYFGYSSYNYANMPASISTSSPTSQISEIAKLIYHCGVSVEMMYGANGSGASVSDAPNALKQYFKYSSNYGTVNPQYKSKSSYTSSNWISLLKSELDQWRPVIYRGQETGGHAFVCDGYDDQNYFHFNWGWSGSYNGYYILTDLTPGPYTFNSSQGMVINIQGNTPLIKTDQTSLYFLCESNTTSEAKHIAVRGVALSSNITITVPANFQISLDGTNFSSSLNVSNSTSGIYVRYVPTAAGTTTDYGALTLTSGSVTKTVALTGRTYALDCNPPQNVQYTSDNNGNVQLSWNAPTQDIHSYRFSIDSTTTNSIWGLGASNYLLAQRACDSDLVAYHQKSVTQVSFYIPDYVVANSSDRKIIIYQGGSIINNTLNEGTLIREQSVSSFSSGWNTVTLNNPVTIDAHKELWYGVQFNTTYTYPVPVGTNPGVAGKGDLVKKDGSWTLLSSYSNSNIHRNIPLKITIQDSPSSITNYTIQRNNSIVGTSTSTQYNDHVTSSGNYTYNVTANWDNGCSATSEDITMDIITDCTTTYGDTTAVECVSFTWYDSTYTVSTETATHTFAGGNAHGCDSTVTLHLTVNPTYYFPENRTVNQGSLPFNWHGKTFNASATAYDSLTTTAGCDSVYFLNLTVTAFNIIEDNPIALCQGETANWRGHLLTEQGTYRDTVLAENNIYTVVVTVNPTYYFPENITVTQGSLPFNWHGKTFNTSATAYDSLTTTAGCDSVFFLTLTVTAFNIVQDNPIALCQGETANWRGHLLAEQGTYRDTVLAENNIYTVDVTVNPTYFFPENVTVTQGSLPFNWHGKTFNASTTAYDSLTTTAGCDSVYYLNLTVTPFNIIQDTPIALCQGETANWRGKMLSEQGAYRDTVLAENNIYTVDVTVNPTYFFPENVTVTQGSLPFNWHGKTFNASTTAYDSLTTTAGCDSVFFLILTVTPFNIIEDTPIALCQGETANWRGHLLTEQGTYRDTVLAENNIYTVVVTVNPTYYFPENITVTQGSLPFNWHGKTFNTSATAYDSLTTTVGCDSVYFLTLNVTAFNIVHDDPIALCQGETANWRGKMLSEQGAYRDTVLAENTIHTVVVTVNPTYYFPENITVTQGSLPYNWHGKTFNASTTAYDSLTTTAGCDSVYFLTLTVTAFNIIEDTPIALCQGETANWRGHLLSEQGTYRDTALAENNIHTVVVTVNPTYYFPENRTVNQGSLPFNWHGKTFNASATAYDSLTTTAGCDSVYFLNLTVTAFNIIEDNPIALCQGETANWRGHLLTEQGTYRDTVLTENTIHTVEVTVNPTYFFSENHTVTQGSLPFNWHGKTFNASTTAYDSLTTTAGCDSVFFLTLTVTAFNIVQDNPISLCQGETANWRGHLLAEQGTYRDTVLAENNIYTVDVTVNPTYFFLENVTVTQGSLPFNWHGKTFNASATAYDSLTTTAGCDSVYFLTLNVTAFNIVHDDPIALCQGETANWRGKMLSEQGAYRDTVLAENTIHTVVVTVNPTYFFSENFTVAQGSLPFNWHGKTFNASTTAYDSLTTTAGCDSVFFLTLTVTAFNIVQDDPIALCQGETANWRGHLLAEQGTYSDTALAENNIYTVDVTVNPTYYFPENITVTQGSLPFNWHGKTFNASATAYDSLTTTAGCDSVFFLTLSVTPFNIIVDTPIALCQGETANWRGHLLSEQGAYRDTVLAENNIYTVVVTVNPTYAVDTAVTITSNDLPYHFVSGQIDTTFEIGTAQLSTFNFQLSTQYGCDSTVTLTLTINVGIEDYEKEGGLTVHPNPTTGVLNINGHDPFTQIQVLDAFGRIIRNYPAEGTQTIIDLNGLAPGVYIIRATNSNRVVGLKKIVKVNL